MAILGSAALVYDGYCDVSNYNYNIIIIMIKIKKYFLSLMFHALLNHTMHFYTIKSNVVVPIPDIPCIFTFSELNWIVCFVLFLNHIIPADVVFPMPDITCIVTLHHPM